MFFRKSLLASCLLILTATPLLAQRGEAPVVGVDAVRRETSAQTAPLAGRLVPREAGTVAAITSGPVVSFQVEVGDRVEAGQVLARLSTTALTLQRDLAAAAVTEAEAKLGETRAQVQVTTNELQRLEGLRSSAAFSQARYQDKMADVARGKSSVAVAEANVLKAKATLRLAEVDLQNATVVAPYPGVISERHTEVGSYVSAGAPVVSMVNDRNLEIEADVPGTRLGGLVPGLSVRVELAGGVTAPATIRAVVPSENPRTRTRLMRLTPDLSQVPAGLAANQSVTILFPVGGGREMLTVAKDAVLRRDGQDVVYVVEGDTAALRPVTVGASLGGRFEIVQGLAEGELAVVLGNERLQPGEKVSVQEAR